MKGKMWDLAGKKVPGVPVKNEPRLFFVMHQANLQNYDYPGSGGLLVKTLEQGIEGAEKMLAKQGQAGVYYVMEIKKVVKSEAVVTTKVEDPTPATAPQTEEDQEQDAPKVFFGSQHGTSQQTAPSALPESQPSDPEF